MSAPYSVPPPKPEVILQSPNLWRPVSRDAAFSQPALVVVVRQAGGRLQSLWLREAITRPPQASLQDRYFQLTARPTAGGAVAGGAVAAGSGVPGGGAASGGFSLQSAPSALAGVGQAGFSSWLQKQLYGLRKSFKGGSTNSTQGQPSNTNQNSGGGSNNPPPKNSGGPPKKQKTWIEIKLLDELGEPIPNQQFELTLPDGSVRKGTLDAVGHYRVDDIDPGNCTVIFPGIDKIARN